MAMNLVAVSICDALFGFGLALRGLITLMLTKRSVLAMNHPSDEPHTNDSLKSLERGN